MTIPSFCLGQGLTLSVLFWRYLWFLFSSGFHSRKVYCIDKRFSDHRRVMNDTFCDAAEKPSTRKPCIMYCPGDCAVGYWSSWSKCSSRCPKPGHRRRERTVLRYPSHDGKSCSGLEEYQACNLKHCYRHYWRTTKWSTCLFYRGMIPFHYLLTVFVLTKAFYEQWRVVCLVIVLSDKDACHCGLVSVKQ